MGGGSFSHNADIAFHWIFMYIFFNVLRRNVCVCKKERGRERTDNQKINEDEENVRTYIYRSRLRDRKIDRGTQDKNINYMFPN